MSSPETIKSTPENQIDSKEMDLINAERHEALRDSLEKAEKEHGSTSKESILDIKKEAVSQAKSSEKFSPGERSPAQKRTGAITKMQRDNSFKKQMDNITPHLTKRERAFSKIIHNKSVEKVSDGIAKTIARPNALLAGSVAAFIAVTLIYVIAKHYGYSLSGFETMAAFTLGWALGLIYDYARLLVNNKRN